eukprot:6174780-Pleurochrysis_carterae.AAC.1
MAKSGTTARGRDNECEEESAKGQSHEALDHALRALLALPKRPRRSLAPTSHSRGSAPSFNRFPCPRPHPPGHRGSCGVAVHRARRRSLPSAC